MDGRMLLKQLGWMKKGEVSRRQFRLQSVNCNWMGQGKQEFSKRAGANEALAFILF
jgi:hypothetical protein